MHCEDLSEYSWYDFGLVQFTGSMHGEEEDDNEEENDPDPNKICSVKILGFDHYQQTLNTSSSTHLHEMKDETLYDIVHAALNYLPIDTLQKIMVQYFTLGDFKIYVYILGINCIVSPLFVILDKHGTGEKKTIGINACLKRMNGHNT